MLDLEGEVGSKLSVVYPLLKDPHERTFRALLCHAFQCLTILKEFSSQCQTSKEQCWKIILEFKKKKRKRRIHFFFDCLRVLPALPIGHAICHCPKARQKTIKQFFCVQFSLLCFSILEASTVRFLFPYTCLCTQIHVNMWWNMYIFHMLVNFYFPEISWKLEEGLVLKIQFP